MFKTPEYQHLLLAERVMAEILEKGDGKLSELAQCARALVDLVVLKRNMRGDPNPKPVDVSEGKRKRRAPAHQAPVPTDTIASAQPPPDIQSSAKSSASTA